MHATALEPDLKQLKGGEFCEIGEKGVTLSGGQKQRVSLARAAYEPGDFVLLDDPLSAVDATVGKHIFDKLLSRRTGLLRESSILLVTHQLQFLPRCDTIAVMADGEVEHYGRLVLFSVLLLLFFFVFFCFFLFLFLFFCLFLFALFVCFLEKTDFFYFSRILIVNSRRQLYRIDCKGRQFCRVD